MGDYTMPSLGADMEAGTVVRWLVGPGDAVHRGDVVATIETEKSTIDAEIFEDGVVEKLLVEEGEEVPVGTPLATIAPAPSPAAAPAPPRRARRARARSERPAAPAPMVPAAPTVPAAAARVHSPVVRRLAASLGVDLAAVEGTGPGGAVTRADVQAAVAPRPRSVVVPGPAVAPAAARGHVRAAPYLRRRARELGVDLASVVPTGPGGIVTAEDLERTSGPAGEPTAPAPPAVPEPGATRGRRSEAEQQAALRRQIGLLMARSKREIPHYYLETAVDLSRASSFLAEENLERPPARRLLPAALLLKATALAAREFPDMNGFYVDGVHRPSEAVHLGVAVALRRGGLVAPAIHDADRLGLDEMMAAVADLVARARSGRLRSSEMADPTLTVTSLGDLGVDKVLGVIYPPQVALVGFGRIADRPVAVDGLVGVHPVVTATLAADHRVSDGLRGARFLAAIGRHLQEPEEL